MRYIIIPLYEQSGNDALLTTAFSDFEKEKTGIIIPSSDPNPRGLQQGKNGMCWKYQACFTNSDSVNIIGTVLNRLRSDIDPSGEESFTIDLIVDGTHAKQAGDVLRLLSRAGQWYRTHVIFLSESDSLFGKEQSDFYIKIRSDAGGKAEQSEYGWSWFTMLADENSNGVTGDIIRKQRETLLPFVIRLDHSKDHYHSCYTYAISYEEINFDQLSEIPRALALKYACDILQDREIYEEFSLLLMNGEVCPADYDSQARVLKSNLMPYTGFKPITIPDVLIQKHDPQADFQTRELLDLLLADNPDYDARKYDQATTEEQLLALPWVNKAEKAWEDYVLQNTIKHTDITRIRNQLSGDSEWARRIKYEYTSSYYKTDPLTICTSRISGKKGYNTEAGSDASNDLARVNEGLGNAVFQAILRLISLRMHNVLETIDKIANVRRNAVEAVKNSILQYETTQNMTPKWCASINKQLSVVSSSTVIDLESKEDPYILINKYADSLLEHLKGQLDTKDGYLEMAASENIESLMLKIQNTMTSYPLVNPRFSGGACIKKDDSWLMYKRMYEEFGKTKALPTELPIIACIGCYYLYPASETAPDPEREDFTQTMFTHRISLDIPWDSESTPTQEKPVERNIGIQFEHDQEKKEDASESLNFQWEYEQAEAVNIRYITIDNKLVEEVKRDKQSFGGKYTIVPSRTLPSGMRLNIEVLFLRSGHEIGKYSNVFYYETAKQRLETAMEYTELKGGLFKKIRCRRYRAFNVSVEQVKGYVCVRNEISGCICKHIVWEQDNRDCVSEALPEDGAWSIINRPDSPYIYQMN